MWFLSVVLTLLFVVFKVMEFVSFSWFIVFLPIILYFALVVITWLITGIVALIIYKRTK